MASVAQDCWRAMGTNTDAALATNPPMISEMRDLPWFGFTPPCAPLQFRDRQRRGEKRSHGDGRTTLEECGQGVSRKKRRAKGDPTLARLCCADEPAPNRSCPALPP